MGWRCEVRMPRSMTSDSREKGLIFEWFRRVNLRMGERSVGSNRGLLSRYPKDGNEESKGMPPTRTVGAGLGSFSSVEVIVSDRKGLHLSTNILRTASAINSSPSRFRPPWLVSRVFIVFSLHSIYPFPCSSRLR